MTELERTEQPQMRITRGPTGNGAWVRFSVGGESFEVSVGYDLDEHQYMHWRRYSNEHPERLEGGGDIAWAPHGRIIAAGPKAKRFYEVMTDFGLGFGTIEAELRPFLGHVDP